MKRVCVYPRDGEIGSSSYYRIIQYFNNMPEYNVKLRIFVPECITRLQYNYPNGIRGLTVKMLYHIIVFFTSFIYFIIDCINPPDVLVILRSIEPKTFIFPISFLYKIIVSKARRVIWDIDDDIVESKEISSKEYGLLCKISTYIVVTHEYLKSLLPSCYQYKAVIMPTTDGDIKRKKIVGCLKKRTNRVNIIWIASSAGINDLKAVIPYLDYVAGLIKDNLNKSVCLKVVCNKKINLKYKNLIIDNILWSRQNALMELKNSDIGIMPLLNTKFAKGKGSFKIIQYMSAGIPCVASAVGYNINVVKDGVTGYLVQEENAKNGWIDAIYKLASDSSMRTQMGLNAKKEWEKNYSYQKNLFKWKELLS